MRVQAIDRDGITITRRETRIKNTESKLIDSFDFKSPPVSATHGEHQGMSQSRTVVGIFGS